MADRQQSTIPLIDSDQHSIARDKEGEQQDQGQGNLPIPRAFEPNRQSWKVFRGQLPRMMFTLLLLALFIATLVLWEHNGNVSNRSKRWFNTITTVVNLALGLNFLEVFKDMAKVLRWRVLANRTFTVRETDLILSGESLLKLGKLMWESRRKPITVLGCALWILLNLLAQASIAMLSLNYSMDSGTNTTGIYTVPGIVSAPQLKCFYLFDQCPEAPGAEMTYANTLGQQLQGGRGCPYNDSSQIVNGDQSCAFFYRQDSREFAYRFLETDPGDSLTAFPYLTNRNIRASLNQCFQYNIDWAGSPIISNTDGIDNAQLFRYYNETHVGFLPVPKSQGAFNSTTYIYNGTRLPQDEVDLACGPRCMRMYALRLGDTSPGTSSNIFECEISISEVFNSTLQAHQIGDATARIAAASIGLSGRFTTPNSTKTVWNQYQLYTWGNRWETYQKNADQVGADMAFSAMSALASMSNRNPRQLIPGTLPILGYHVDVDWKFVIALCACIGSVQFLLISIMAWLSRPVVVPDDGFLTTTRLLSGLTAKLQGRGSLLNGRQLAEAIQKTDPGNSRIAYGVVHLDGDGSRRGLEISHNVSTRKDLPGKGFPAGGYV